MVILQTSDSLDTPAIEAYDEVHDRWQECDLWDISASSSNVKVRFNHRPNDWVILKQSNIRRRTEPTAHTWDWGCLDEYVEVCIEQRPIKSWRKAKVLGGKCPLFQLKNPDGTEAWVPQGSVRPVPTPDPINWGAIERRSRSITDKALIEWLHSNEAARQLEAIRIRTKCLQLALEPVETCGVLVLGSPEAIKKGTALMNTLVNHRIMVIKTRLQRERAILRDRGANVGDCMEVSFEVSDSLVGLMLGKGAQRLKKLQETYAPKNVIIKVSGKREAGAPREVSIVGPPALVADCRMELEIVERNYPVHKDQAWYMFDYMDDIKQKSGLFVFRIGEKRSHYVLIGSRQSMEDALAYIDTTFAYQPIYEKFKQEEGRVRTDLVALDKSMKARSRRTPFLANGNVESRQETHNPFGK